MELLSKLEEGMERAMGTVFGTLKRPFSSEALASAILRAVEDSKVQALEEAFAPNQCRVFLNPGDVPSLLSLLPTLGGEVRRFVKGLSGQRGYRLAGPVVVKWEAEPKVRRGEARVKAKVAAGQPRAVLSVVQGAQAGEDFPIESPLVTVGRGEDNDVVIADENVSRHHCELRFTGSDFEVADLDSTNGVILNGQMVSRAIVEDEDALELGRTMLKFHIRLEQ